MRGDGKVGLASWLLIGNFPQRCSQGRARTADITVRKAPSFLFSLLPALQPSLFLLPAFHFVVFLLLLCAEVRSYLLNALVLK